MEQLKNYDNFDAKQAIKNSEETAFTIDKILEWIDQQSKNGNSCVRLMDVKVPFNVMNEILKRGFAISQINGPMGENIINIRW